MRIVALLLAVALIVISGFWLARDRSNGGSADASQVAAQGAEQPGGGPDADGDPQSDEGAGAEGEADEQSGPLPPGYEPLEYLAEEPKRVFDAPGDVLEDDLDYVAVIRTNKGDVVVDLYEDRTPQTVNNFVFLALNRYYEHVPFHRVIEGFMAQTGDPTGTGTGGPGYEFADEFKDHLRHDGKGVVSMANAGPGTNGSQFFITFVPTPWLDGRHSVFGRVIAGEDVLDRIQRVDPGRPGGPQPDVMEKVTIYAKG